MASKNFLLPTQAGQEIYLEALPPVLDQGYYRVRILCHDPQLKILFAFSKNSTYTHYDVEFARKHAARFNITIELIIGDLPNAYVYASLHLVPASYWFGKWWQTLNSIREEFPKNAILKNALSAAHGYCSEARRITVKSEEELGQYPTALYEIINYSPSPFYAVVVERAHQYQYAVRLHAFLPAYIRLQMANIMLRGDLDEIVRVCCDGVVYTKPQPAFPAHLFFVPDPKYTGKIVWKNCKSGCRPGEEEAVANEDNEDASTDDD